MSGQSDHERVVLRWTVDMSDTAAVPPAHWKQFADGSKIGFYCPYIPTEGLIKPMTRKTYTLREIANAPCVGIDYKDEIAHRIARLMNSVSPFSSHSDEDYGGTRITLKVVADVDYGDGRRGARTSVLSFDGEPFVIIGEAGRELRDIFEICIINESAATSAVKDFISFVPVEIEEEDVYDVDKEVALVTWGGPVKLGDKGIFQE